MRAQNVLLIATIVCGLALAAPGAAEDRRIDTQRSTLTVRVFKSGLFRAFADDHIIQAPLAEGSLDDSATPHVQIVIDARRMRVLDPGLSAKDRQEVQTRMLGSEVLDVNRFQRISFHSVAIQRLDAGGWLVRGELELHGQIHAIVVNVFPENSHYKGSATLRQSDFGILPISMVGGTVKVKDEVKIDFDIAIIKQHLSHSALCLVPERFFVGGFHAGLETDEVDLLDTRILLEKTTNFPDRHLCGLLHRIAVHAATDR